MRCAVIFCAVAVLVTRANPAKSKKIAGYLFINNSIATRDGMM